MLSRGRCPPKLGECYVVTIMLHISWPQGKRPQSASPIRKHLLNSPLLGRRNKKNKNYESSDDEVTGQEEIFCGKNYRDLETFQKAQLRQKVCLYLYSTMYLCHVIQATFVKI